MPSGLRQNPAAAGSRIFSAVQEIKREVQVSGIQAPQQIRNHQIIGRRPDVFESRHGQGDESDEQQEPEEGEQTPFEAEKEHGPQDIDQQLQQIHPQGRASIDIVGVEDQVGREGHERIKDRLDQGENKGRWGERGFDEAVETRRPAEESAEKPRSEGEDFKKCKGAEIEFLLGERMHAAASFPWPATV